MRTRNALHPGLESLVEGISSLVREGGVEPPRPHGHTDLNRARLPIPPLARKELHYQLGGTIARLPFQHYTCATAVDYTAT